MSYLAIDPGITTGWAYFDKLGEPAVFAPNPFGYGQVKGIDNFARFLHNIPRELTPKIIIFENYRVNDKKANWGGEIETIQVIGMIKYYAIINDVELVKQEPHQKQMGYRYSGDKPPKNHQYSHYMDAKAHGNYYLYTKKIKKITI